MQRPSRTIAIWVLACAGGGLFLPGVARAQNFQVSPISVEFQPGEGTTTLTVTNDGKDAAGPQIRPFLWSQDAGAERLTATEDLLVSPPITQVDAGLAQTFRLILRRPAAKAEGCYRLLLDELPPPAAPGTVRVALRFSIPVFVEPTARATTSIDWHVILGPQGASLVGVNHGTRHVQVLDPVLSRDAGRALAVKTNGGFYILPNSEQVWPITDGGALRPGVMLQLAARLNGKPIDATVQVVAQ